MKNGLKTTVLLAAMGGLILFIGSLFGATGLYIGLAISILLVGGSYWFSDRIAIAAARAQPVAEADMPEYYRVMHELTTAAGMPMPKLYVSPDPQPNAFATGRNPHHAAVCVTQGLLNHLDWAEIRGVLAHELGHVRNRDILISSVAAAVAMFITFLARMALWGAIFGGRGGGDRNPIGEIALIILAPVAAALLQMAISRSREYEADRTGARLINDGEPLAKALEKLDRASKVIPSIAKPEQAAAYIANPLAGRQMSFKSLFTTHPPMEERIKRLRAGEWRS
jgi:heat shock protein HtpX